MHSNIRLVISFAIACVGGLATALLVLPATAGTNSWTAIGPVAYPFAVDPSSPSTLYSVVNRNTVIDPSPSSPYTVSPVAKSDNAFQINLPEKTTGACPVGTIPVYRLWNQRADSNHRYTTSAATKTQMIAAGYAAEGYGADGVAMCAMQ